MSEDRCIATIAREIRADWKEVNYAARPYLSAMFGLNDVTDSYGADSARSIVAYFLGNAGAWRGETAKRVKAELKVLIASGAERRRLERQAQTLQQHMDSTLAALKG